MGIIDNLENLLASGRDDALLRYSLGNAYLVAGDNRKAAEHLRKALDHDADYSAAWKALGKALAEGGDSSAAIVAYESGIGVAEKKGDIQAAKEMKVFLKRLQK